MTIIRQRAAPANKMGEDCQEGVTYQQKRWHLLAGGRRLSVKGVALISKRAAYISKRTIQQLRCHPSVGRGHLSASGRYLYARWWNILARGAAPISERGGTYNGEGGTWLLESGTSVKGTALTNEW